MYIPRGVGELAPDRLAFCQAYARGDISAFVAPADCVAAGYLRRPEPVMCTQELRICPGGEPRYRPPGNTCAQLCPGDPGYEPVGLPRAGDGPSLVFGDAMGGLKWLAIGGGLMLFLAAFQGARR